MTSPGPSGSLDATLGRAVVVELVHLRTFLAVLEHRGFRNAARHLYLSQPAVTRQVAALEHVVGVPLLVRAAGGAEPTAAGLVLADWAQVLLDDRAQALRRARAATLTGRVVIGLTPGGAGELGAPLARHLRRALPGVELETYAFSFMQWPTVPPPGTDLLLMRDPIADERLRVTTLLLETMALAAPPGSAVLAADRLALDDVLGVTYVQMARTVEHRFVHFWTLMDRRGGDEPRFRGRPSAGPISLGRAIGRGDGAAMATPMIARIFGRPPPPLVAFDQAPTVRLALVSALSDRRPLVDAVHREVAWATRRLGPLVLPELAEGRPL